MLDVEAARDALLTLLASEDVRDIVNLELITLLRESPDPSFHVPDIAKSLANLGKFEATSHDIFVRPGPVSFADLAGKLGRVHALNLSWGTIEAVKEARSDSPYQLPPPLFADRPARRAYSPPPFRVGSQLYVAFFGGSAALTAIAYRNARRLHDDHAASRILTVGVCATIAITLAGMVLSALYGAQVGRVVARGLAVVLFFALGSMQDTGQKRFYLHHAEDEHASLWGPGFVATMTFGVVQGLLVTVPAWFTEPP